MCLVISAQVMMKIIPLVSTPAAWLHKHLNHFQWVQDWTVEPKGIAGHCIDNAYSGTLEFLYFKSALGQTCSGVPHFPDLPGVAGLAPVVVSVMHYGNLLTRVSLLVLTPSGTMSWTDLYFLQLARCEHATGNEVGAKIHLKQTAVTAIHTILPRALSVQLTLLIVWS